MHVQIVLINGQRFNLPMSWVAVLNGPGRLGEIVLDVEKGIQHRIPKSAIVGVLEFTDDKWGELVANEKLEAENRKAQEKAQARQRVRDQIAAWNKMPWLKRIGRKCPYTLPADIAEAPKGV